MTLLRIWLTVLATFTPVMCGIGSVWADEPLKEKTILKGHTETVVSLAFSPDGKMLASGSGDHSIKLWDLATGKNTKTLTKASEYWPEGVKFSPDDKLLACGDFETITLWNLDTGKSTKISCEGVQHTSPIIVFSPDGKTLAVGGNCMREIHLRDVATGKKLITIEGYDEYGITALSFTPDGKTLASMGWHDGMKLWDTSTGKLKSTQKIEDSACAAFSPDCKLLATGSFLDWDSDVIDNSKVVIKKPAYVKLWDVSSGKELTSLKGHAKTVRHLAFSPDGKLLASGDGGRNNSLRVWDVATYKEKAVINGYISKDTHYFTFAFSPDGKTLALGSEDKSIKLWDVIPKK